MKNDWLILEKVLAKDMHHLTYLLSSSNQPLQKAESFYKFSHQRTVSNPTTNISINLEAFFRTLVKPLMLPELDLNGNFKESPVFLALSSKLQQNIILFARRFGPHFNYESWIHFLQRNFSYLDRWCKVILSEEINKDSKFCCLSSETINELQKWRIKYPTVKQFEQKKLRRTSEVLSTPPNKRQRCQSPDDFFMNDDLDEHEMISACEKTELEFNLSKSSGTENQRKITKESEMITEDVPSFIRDNLSAIEQLVHESQTQMSTEMIQLFVDCPLQCFSLFLDRMKVRQWDTNLVLSLIRTFVESDTMSFEKMRLFLSQSITSRLNEQKGSMSRELYQVILDVFAKCKRVSVIAIVGECLLYEQYRNIHTDLIGKLFSGNILSSTDINTILDYALTRRNISTWNEEFLATLDMLVLTKADLNDNVKMLLISRLVSVADEFKKSLKLMKLVISFAQVHHIDFRNRFAESMKIVIDKNETFLKKKALKLL